MRYNTIKLNDIANGKGINVSLYTQGCPHHCKGCFNSETWDFNGGKEFTEETKEYLISNLNTNGIDRNLSILGGEPLCDQNIDGVIDLCKEVKKLYPHKIIYVWTGYIIEDFNDKQKEIFEYVDYIIDGPFKLDKKDLTLEMRGSSNQRIIHIEKSFNEYKLKNKHITI